MERQEVCEEINDNLKDILTKEGLIRAGMSEDEICKVADRYLESVIN